MSNFTPGPWRIGHHTAPSKAIEEMLEAGEPLTVATLPGTGNSPETCMFICLILGTQESVDFANANLIAAAPELYAALEACIPLLRNTPLSSGFQIAPMLDDARNALAKARGEA